MGITNWDVLRANRTIIPRLEAERLGLLLEGAYVTTNFSTSGTIMFWLGPSTNTGLVEADRLRRVAVVKLNPRQPITEQADPSGRIMFPNSEDRLGFYFDDELSETRKPN